MQFLPEWGLLRCPLARPHPPTDAAELLSFLAYFDHRDIWYELIQGGASDHLPWTQRVTQSKIRFQRSMSKLQDYNLVEATSDSYQLHPCLHDWLVGSPNEPPKGLEYLTALRCVAECIPNVVGPTDWMSGRRLLEHARKLLSSRYRGLWQFYVRSSDNTILNRLSNMAALMQDWREFDLVLETYSHVLPDIEEHLGVENGWTLKIVVELGFLYEQRGELDKAEPMYLRAQRAFEKTLEPDNSWTLRAVTSLGSLYRKQGKLGEVEVMYIRALAIKENTLGVDHWSTLKARSNLATIYRQQGKLDAAEVMYLRALAGYEKTLGPDSVWTMFPVHQLGVLYQRQGKLNDAEKMYLRALSVYEKEFGRDHGWTLTVVENPSPLYRHQQILDEARELLARYNKGKD